MKNREKYREAWNKANPNNPIIKGDGYIIHHIDGNHNNDDPSNLQKMTQAEHAKLHYSNPSKRIEVRKKISESHKGSKNPFYGKKHSDGFRNNASKLISFENNPKAKLTWKTVEWIRDILNSQEYIEASKKGLVDQNKLAKLFGISQPQISAIKNNKTWRIND